MSFAGTNWTTTRMFSVILGLTLVSVVGLPFLGVAIETAKPTTRFAGLDRFLVFEGILYALSGIVSAVVVCVLMTKRSSASPFWTIVLTGVGTAVLVPLVFLLVLPASMTSYFLLYVLVTSPTLLGAYLVASAVLARRHSNVFNN